MIFTSAFVLADTFPMLIAACIVGVFSCALVLVVGLWMVSDR